MKPKKLEKKLIFNKSTVANLSNAEKRRILGGDATPEYMCPATDDTCVTCETCEGISCITCPAVGCGSGSIATKCADCGPTWE